MAKCGCGGSCGCRVIAGRGARISGTGTLNDPYVIDAYPMSLTVLDSSTVDLTLTGTGTEADPWVVSADVGGSAFDDKWTMWVGTQTEYDALGSYDSGTLYGITGP